MGEGEKASVYRDRIARMQELRMRMRKESCPLACWPLMHCPASPRSSYELNAFRGVEAVMFVEQKESRRTFDSRLSEESDSTTHSEQGTARHCRTVPLLPNKWGEASQAGATLTSATLYRCTLLSTPRHDTNYNLSLSYCNCEFDITSPPVSLFPFPMLTSRGDQLARDIRRRQRRR